MIGVREDLGHVVARVEAQVSSATFSDIVPVRPKPAPMTFTLALRGRVAFELLAQLQLLELARRGHRDGLYELVGVWQPEPGEVHFEVGVQLVLRRARLP